MFKHDFVGRLGLVLSISVLASACAPGEIGDGTGAQRLGPENSDTDGGIGPWVTDIPGEPEVPGADIDPSTDDPQPGEPNAASSVSSFRSRRSLWPVLWVSSWNSVE